MTARFAGSRTLGERRRRYLATNDRDGSVQPPNVAAPPIKADAERPNINLRHFPLRKVISPKAWKVTLTGLSIALVGILIVGLESGGWVSPDVFGPGWQRMIEGQPTRLSHLFHAGLLMASGQLALVIWWARSQSLRDFEGQYRIWIWTALALFIAGWGRLAQWHWVFSDTICWLWPARFPKREVICWMFPACLVAGLLWKKLCADMRECKGSYALMGIGLAMGLSACVFRLEFDRTGWTGDMKQLAIAGFQTAGCVGIFVSLLVHARFVIHISAEAPETRPTYLGRVVQWIKLLLHKLPKPRLKLSVLWQRKPNAPADKPVKTPKRPRKSSPPATDAKTSKVEQPEEVVMKSAPPKTGETVSDSVVTTSPKVKPPEPKIDVPTPPTEASKPVKPAAISPSKPNPVVKTEPPKPAPIAKTEPPKPVKAEPLPMGKATQPSPPAKPATPPKAPEPIPLPESDDDSDQDEEGDETQYRVDRPIESGQLKGLSKKERRKLRKQHRDSQRDS